MLLVLHECTNSYILRGFWVDVVGSLYRIFVLDSRRMLVRCVHFKTLETSCELVDLSEARAHFWNYRRMENVYCTEHMYFDSKPLIRVIEI